MASHPNAVEQRGNSGSSAKELVTSHELRQLMRCFIDKEKINTERQRLIAAILSERLAKKEKLRRAQEQQVQQQELLNQTVHARVVGGAVVGQSSAIVTSRPAFTTSDEMGGLRASTTATQTPQQSSLLLGTTTLPSQEVVQFATTARGAAAKRKQWEKETDAARQYSALMHVLRHLEAGSSGDSDDSDYDAAAPKKPSTPHHHHHPDHNNAQQGAMNDEASTTNAMATNTMMLALQKKHQKSKSRRRESKLHDDILGVVANHQKNDSSAAAGGAQQYKHLRELEREEFIQRIKTVLPHRTVADLNDWFDMLDADGRGVVSWGTLSTFLLFRGQYNEATDARLAEFAQNPVPLSCPNKHMHSELISASLLAKKSGKLYTGGAEGDIRVWNAQTLELQNVAYSCPGSWISGMCFLRGGARLLAVGVDRRVVILDTRTHDVIRAYASVTRLDKPNPQDENAPAPSSHSNLQSAATQQFEKIEVVVGGADGLAGVPLSVAHQQQITGGGAQKRKANEPSAPSGTRPVSQPGSHRQQFYQSIVRPSARNRTDGSDLGLGTPTSARVANMVTRRMEQHTMVGLSDAPLCCVSMGTTPEGADDIVFGLRDGSLRRFSIPVHPAPILKMSQKPMRIHLDDINGLKYSSHMAGIFSCSADATLKLTDMDRDTVVRTFGSPNASSSSVHSLVGAHHQPSAHIAHKRGILSLDWSESLKVLVSCSYERSAYVWDPMQDQPIYCLSGFSSPLLSIGLNEDDHQVVTLSADHTLRVYDIRTFGLLQTLEPPGRDSKYRSILVDNSRIYCNAYFPQSFVLRRDGIKTGGGGSPTTTAHDSPSRSDVNSSSPGMFHPIGSDAHLNDINHQKRNKKAVPVFHGHLTACIGAFIDTILERIITVDGEKAMMWDYGGRLLYMLDLLSISRNDLVECRVTCACLDPQKTRLVCGYTTGSVAIWHLPSGQVLSQMLDFEAGKEAVQTVGVLMRQNQAMYMASCGPTLSLAVDQQQYVMGHYGAWSCPREFGHITCALALECGNGILCGTMAGAIVLVGVVHQEQEGEPMWASQQHRERAEWTRTVLVQSPNTLNFNSPGASPRNDATAVTEQQASIAASASPSTAGPLAKIVDGSARVEKLMALPRLGTSIILAAYADGRLAIWDHVQRVLLGECWANCVDGVPSGIALQDTGTRVWVTYGDDAGRLYFRSISITVVPRRAGTVTLTGAMLEVGSIGANPFLETPITQSPSSSHQKATGIADAITPTLSGAFSSGNAPHQHTLTEAWKARFGYAIISEEAPIIAQLQRSGSVFPIGLFADIVPFDEWANSSSAVQNSKPPVTDMQHQHATKAAPSEHQHARRESRSKSLFAVEPMKPKALVLTHAQTHTLTEPSTTSKARAESLVQLVEPVATVHDGSASLFANRRNTDDGLPLEDDPNALLKYGRQFSDDETQNKRNEYGARRASVLSNDNNDQGNTSSPEHQNNNNRRRRASSISRRASVAAQESTGVGRPTPSHPFVVFASHVGNEATLCAICPTAQRCIRMGDFGGETWSAGLYDENSAATQDPFGRFEEGGEASFASSAEGSFAGYNAQQQTLTSSGADTAFSFRRTSPADRSKRKARQDRQRLLEHYRSQHPDAARVGIPRDWEVLPVYQPQETDSLSGTGTGFNLLVGGGGDPQQRRHDSERSSPRVGIASSGPTQPPLLPITSATLGKDRPSTRESGATGINGLTSPNTSRPTTRELHQPSSTSTHEALSAKSTAPGRKQFSVMPPPPLPATMQPTREPGEKLPSLLVTSAPTILGNMGRRRRDVITTHTNKNATTDEEREEGADDDDDHDAPTTTSILPDPPKLAAIVTPSIELAFLGRFCRGEQRHGMAETAAAVSRKVLSREKIHARNLAIAKIFTPSSETTTFESLGDGTGASGANALTNPYHHNGQSTFFGTCSSENSSRVSTAPDGASSIRGGRRVNNNKEVPKNKKGGEEDDDEWEIPLPPSSSRPKQDVGPLAVAPGEIHVRKPVFDARQRRIVRDNTDGILRERPESPTASMRGQRPVGYNLPTVTSIGAWDDDDGGDEADDEYDLLKKKSSPLLTKQQRPSALHQEGSASSPLLLSATAKDEDHSRSKNHDGNNAKKIASASQQHLLGVESASPSASMLRTPRSSCVSGMGSSIRIKHGRTFSSSLHLGSSSPNTNSNAVSARRTMSTSTLPFSPRSKGYFDHAMANLEHLKVKIEDTYAFKQQAQRKGFALLQSSSVSSSTTTTAKTAEGDGVNNKGNIKDQQGTHGSTVTAKAGATAAAKLTLQAGDTDHWTVRATKELECEPLTDYDDPDLLLSVLQQKSAAAASRAKSHNAASNSIFGILKPSKAFTTASTTTASQQQQMGQQDGERGVVPPHHQLTTLFPSQRGTRAQLSASVPKRRDSVAFGLSSQGGSSSSMASPSMVQPPMNSQAWIDAVVEGY